MIYTYIKYILKYVLYMLYICYTLYIYIYNFYLIAMLYKDKYNPVWIILFIDFSSYLKKY